MSRENKNEISLADFYIGFSIENGVYVVKNRHSSDDFKEWSAENEETFLKLFIEQTQANLLGQKFTSIDIHAPLISILKSHGLFEQYQNVLQDEPIE